MENNLIRKENESLFNYYKRITLNKKVYDADYVEWGEALLGTKGAYSSDNYRKTSVKHV